MPKSQKLKTIIENFEKDQESAEKICIKLKRTPRKIWFGIHLYRMPLWLSHNFGYMDPKAPFCVSWDYWKKKIQRICPIQYWFRETLRTELHFWFVTWLDQKWYEFKCFWSPWNILKIHTIPRTWTDEDHLLTHAMFAVLERYMNEKPDTVVDFTSTAKDRKFWKEINEVWDWWQHREERERIMSEAYKLAHARSRDLKYRTKYREVNMLERKYDEEEREMLLRIIKWKDHLWV